MKSQFLMTVVLVTGVAIAFPTFASSDATDTTPQVTDPEVLLTEVLEADRRGDITHRDRLLETLEQVSPESQLANWLKGQVEFQGQWIPVERVKNFVTSDRRWREYQQRVETAEPSVTSHALLARWCRSQKLENEERWHWLNVLWHNPQHREAQGSLGVKPYLGDFFTTDQIAANEAQRRQAKTDFKRFTSELQTRIKEAEVGDAEQREVALEEIAQLDDTAAIPALVHAVLDNERTEQRVVRRLGSVDGPEMIQQFQQAVVDSLSRMIEHQATMGLVTIALNAHDPEIRTYAAASLKPRPEMDFVPQLMGALARPIEASFAISAVPDGPVLVVEEFAEAGPESEASHVRSSSFLTQHRVHDNRTFGPITYRPRPKISTATNSALDLAKATTRVEAAKQRVALENEFREFRNARIIHVLEIVTGEKLDDDPADWWSSWREYNELDTPEELPKYNTRETHYDHNVTDNYLYGDYSPRPPAAPTPLPHPDRPQPPPRAPGYRCCFVAGTPVWTQSGPVPIEKIRVGDLVLSQDPTSGKLSFRPIVGTSVRPPSPVVNVSTSTETIGAARGHRFWLTGEGWRMAKQLEPGDRVFAIGGSTDIQDVEPAGEQEAFNLVVAGFHTYFVGQAKLLVHDNSRPMPTVNGIPGIRRTTQYNFETPLAAK